MKKAVLILVSLYFVVSCNQKITKNDISKINGYWEIEKVLLPNGDKKVYKVNESIDFFEIKNNKGFRKKVFPQFNGKYLVNDVKENITITDSSGIFFINYSTDYSKWKEQIVTLKDSTLVLKNDAKATYHFKKYKSFSLK